MQNIIQKTISWAVVALCLAVFGVAACKASATPPVSFTANTPIPLTSAGISLTVISGSMADSVVVNAGNIVVSMSSSTGGTFTITSPQSITVSTGGSGGSDSVSCYIGTETDVITQSSGSEVFTLTPSGSACNNGSSGGGSGGGLPSSDVGVSMAVDNENPQPGSTIHYTVTASVLGPSASPSVTVQDNLPVGLTFVSATPSAGSFNASNGVWAVGGLSANGTATLVIAATVNPGTAGQAITNNAVISESGAVDTNSSNNTATQVVTVASVTTTAAGTTSSGGGGGGGGSSLSVSPVTATPTVAAPSALSQQALQAQLNTLIATLRALIAQATAEGISLPAGVQQFAGSGTAAAFTEDLSFGMTNAQVNSLQLFLISRNTGPLAAKLAANGASGWFGPLTESALKEFQKSVGISATGYFGPKTRAYVNSLNL